MCLNYTCIIFIFLNLRLHVIHGIIVLLKKSISYFMNVMFKHIIFNFGVISFINKETVSLFSTAHL